MDNHEQDDTDEPNTLNESEILVGLLVAIGLGAACTLAYPSSSRWIAGLWALACLAVGVGTGFLFGIPRIGQQKEGGSEAGAEKANYRQQVNTNLEQISDWLTKIIVAVGLVELVKIPSAIVKCAQVFDPQTSTGAAFATAVIVYFTICGFLVGYLMTRLVLASAFSRADQRAAAVLDRRLDSLARKVATSEAETSKTSKLQPGAQPLSSRPSWQEYVREYNRIVSAAVSNVEKVLAVAILIERMISEASADVAIEGTDKRGAAQVIRALSEHKLISSEEAAAFREFWEIRNQVVHGRTNTLTDSQTARLLDLAWRLVRTFA